MYVEQEDQHMPELTVRETFNFSNCCQGVGSNAGALHRHLPAWIGASTQCKLKLYCCMTGCYTGWPEEGTPSVIGLGVACSDRGTTMYA